jgi:hypothetical protein
MLILLWRFQEKIGLCVSRIYFFIILSDPGYVIRKCLEKYFAEQMNEIQDRVSYQRVFLSQSNQDFVLDAFWYILLDRFGEYFSRDVTHDINIIFSRMARNFAEISFSLIKRKPIASVHNPHVKRMDLTNVNMERIHSGLTTRCLFYSFGNVFQQNRRDFEAEEFQLYLKCKVSEWFYGISEPIRTHTIRRVNVPTNPLATARSSRPSSASSTRRTSSRPGSAMSYRSTSGRSSIEPIDESQLKYTPRNVQELLKEEQTTKKDERPIKRLQNAVKVINFMSRAKKLTPQKSENISEIEKIFNAFDDQEKGYVPFEQGLELLFDEESQKLSECMKGFKQELFHNNWKTMMLEFEEEKKQVMETIITDSKELFDMNEEFAEEDRFEQELMMDSLFPTIAERYTAKRRKGIPQQRSVMFTNFSNLVPGGKKDVKMVVHTAIDPLLDEHGRKRMHFVDPKEMTRKLSKYKKFDMHAKTKESPLVSRYIHDLRSSRHHAKGRKLVI